jgi:hypothetical protein
VVVRGLGHHLHPGIREKGEQVRKAIALLLTVGAAGVVALVGVSSAVGESGPRCADITDANWNYLTAGEVSVGLVLDGAGDALASTPCKSVTYTLVISGVNQGPIVIRQKGDHLFEDVEISDADNNICISATAGSSGGKVHDAAPNAGCFEITLGTSGAGAGGFN